MARRRRWSFLMAPLDHGPILWLDDLHRGLLTPAGRVLFWSATAAGTILLGGLTTPLLYCFGFSVSALLLAAVLGFLFRPRLRMTRHIGVFPTAGEVFCYRVTAENIGRRAARNVVIEERGLPPEIRPAGDPPRLESLAPGERACVTVQLRCLRRGAFELARLQAATLFPTGLFKSGRQQRHSDRLLVYPRVAPVEIFDLPQVCNYQPGGIAVASQVGESTEFFATRDWRYGDRVRDIHWPSTARSAKLIAKEFHEEYFVRLAVVLDVEVLAARHEAQLERAISLTAGITDVLVRREYIVDIYAAGSNVFHFQAGRALAHFDNILEILACLEPDKRLDIKALEAVLIPETPRLSAVIFVMMHWDAGRANLVQLLKSLGVAVRAASLRKGRPPTGLDPSEVVEAPG